MATKLELNQLDHKIYSAIKQIRGQKNRADINSIHKEIVKANDFEAISKEFLNERIEMLLQNDKIINRSNTTVIAGESIINVIHEEHLSGKYGVVKVRNFPGATIEDTQHNLVPILKINPCRLILHVGTNNAESCTSREILDKLSKLKTFISVFQIFIK